ncbi:MAG TPA: hypothetical protein VMB21_14240 [Candidatus Limnocylindria bacterium]|nr:hypothetical protein [Candidatus Limnocylindria bacterium]
MSPSFFVSAICVVPGKPHDMTVEKITEIVRQCVVDVDTNSPDFSRVVRRYTHLAKLCRALTAQPHPRRN